METPGDRIKMLREARDWSQQELADRLKRHLRGTGHTVSREAISQWERGETKNIRPVAFYWLVHEFGTTYEYILFGPEGRGAPGARRRRAASGDKEA